MAKARKVVDAAPPVYQLKVTLLDSEPSIWRRCQVESGITLERLHRILQIVMGWTDSHWSTSTTSATAGAERGAEPPDEPTGQTLR